MTASAPLLPRGVLPDDALDYEPVDLGVAEAGAGEDASRRFPDRVADNAVRPVDGATLALRSCEPRRGCGRLAARFRD